MGSELARVFITTFLLLELLSMTFTTIYYFRSTSAIYPPVGDLPPPFPAAAAPRLHPASFDFRLQAPLGPSTNEEKEPWNCGEIPKYSRAEVKIVASRE